MPYDGERANPEGVSALLVSPLIRERLGTYSPASENSRAEDLEDVPRILARDLPGAEASSVHVVVSLDGSVASVCDEERDFEAGFVKVALVRQALARYRALNQERFVDQRALDACYSISTREGVLPGYGLQDLGDSSDQGVDKFRLELFEILRQTTYSSKSTETLLDVLIELLQGSAEVKCMGCGRSTILQKDPIRCGTSTRSGETCSMTLYPTDILEVHWKFNEHGDNGERFSTTMIVMERLMMAGILGTMRGRSPEVMASTAFILDGPLSFFEAHTLVEPLLKHIQGLPGLIICGVEKTGRLNLFARREMENGRLKAGELLMVTADLRERVSGARTKAHLFYGQHFIYRSRDGRRTFVFTAPPRLGAPYSGAQGFERWENFPTLRVICELFEELYSEEFSRGGAGALTPIVKANSEASIPMALGETLLRELLREVQG